MKKLGLLLFVIMTTLFAKSYKIEYSKFYNSKKLNDKAVTIFTQNLAFLSNKNNNEHSVIDYSTNKSTKILKIANKQFKTTTSFDSFHKAKIIKDTTTILNFKCQKAIYNVFSNKIEVWFTKNSKIKGSPSLSNFPENSLVLKYVINNNFTYLATKIKIIDNFVIPDYYTHKSSIVSEAKYQKLLIEFKFETITVFNKEHIYFDNNFSQNKKHNELHKTYSFSKGTIILKKIKLPKDYQKKLIFAKLTNWSNGDAYDRTGTIFTLSDSSKFWQALDDGIDCLPKFIANNNKEYQGFTKTKEYTPPLELMRFYTSFGVGYFNKKRVIKDYNWQDSVVYKQEITNLIDSDLKTIWFGIFIGNYDKGGHKISLDLNFYPYYDETPKKHYISPLFTTVNILEMSGQNYGSLFASDTLKVEFNLPANIFNLQLRFTTTGHGGFSNGDEFNKRINKIIIDDMEYFRIIPWRSDCASFRMSNPTSGNFSNGMSSSDLSRSNWAPATLTLPYYIPLEDLKSGKHKLKLIIDQGKDEGNMFNHWSVSGTLLGKKK